MNLNQMMAKDVKVVLEEATGIVTNRLIMESLLSNNKITIEEAQLLNKLASEVITEAAEDFIPEAIKVSAATKKAMAGNSTSAHNMDAKNAENDTLDKREPSDWKPADDYITESEAIVNNLINKLF